MLNVVFGVNFSSHYTCLQNTITIIGKSLQKRKNWKIWLHRQLELMPLWYCTDCDAWLISTIGEVHKPHRGHLLYFLQPCVVAVHKKLGVGFSASSSNVILRIYSLVDFRNVALSLFKWTWALLSSRGGGIQNSHARTIWNHKVRYRGPNGQGYRRCRK